MGPLTPSSAESSAELALLRGANRILEAALTSRTEEELGFVCLTVAVELTKSAFGFIGEVTDNGRMREIAISQLGWEACSMYEKRAGHERPHLELPMEGLYGYVLSTGETLWTNDPENNAHSTGSPSGHPPLTAYLGIPLLYGGQVVGVLSLANREGGYRPGDVELAESLAPAIATAIQSMRISERLGTFRTLFQSIDEGFSLMEMLYDDSGDAHDALFLEVNPAFERHTGISVAPGVTLKKMVPDMAEGLIEVFERVARTGEPERQENFSEPLGRYFDMYTFRFGAPEQRRVAVVLENITKRKLAEFALRRSNERFEILSEANALLLSSIKPEALIQTIAEKVMRHLECDVFLNYILDEAHGTLRLNAYWGISEEDAERFEWLDAGSSISGCVSETGMMMVTEDIQNHDDPQAALVRSLGLQAYACLPLRMGPKAVGTLAFGTRQKSFFEKSDLELMSTVADAMSVAMSRSRGEDALRRSEELYRKIVTTANEGIVWTDPEGIVTFVNEVMAGWIGSTPDALLGKNGFDFVHPDDIETVRVEHARRIKGLAGRYTLRVGPKGGPYKWLMVSGTPLTDAEGNYAGNLTMFADISELKDTEQRLSDSLARTTLLKELASATASSLDPHELSERTLLIAHEFLDAELSSIYLLSDGQGPAKCSARFGYKGDGLGPDEIELDEQTLAGRALVRGTTQTLAGDTPPPPKTAERMAATGTSDYRLACSPIIVRGNVIGVVCLGFCGTRLFRDDEVDLYEAVADQLGVGLENARLYESEHNIAETLQETLVVLPTHVPGIAFSRSYESATFQTGRVGGDFVDVFEVHGHLIGITLGDVSGKGIDAAVTTSLVRMTLRVHAIDGLLPAQVAAKANQVLRRFTATESFVTVWFGLLNTRTGLLRFLSAGHPPALVIDADGEVEELECQNPMIGGYDEAKFYDCQVFLRPGERLVLYSDGVTEARSPSGHFLDAAGLLESVKRHKDVPTVEMADAIMADVLRFSARVLRDDAAILTVEPVKLHQRAEQYTGQHTGQHD